MKDPKENPSNGIRPTHQIEKMKNSRNEQEVIGDQYGSCLWWMTYGSLVNMLLMVSMDDIWVIGQHGNCLWCPWMTYGSLVNMYFFKDAIKKSKEIANRHAIGSDGENNSRLGKNFNSRGFLDEECLQIL
ncbi:unnamed protein product [Lactuca saligna]|uniref:Uncharacterized protein n=1 Tax=Lactuca saligna TaxID=75948 RepID=A0AA36A0P4_LACSI|nr:unnamed protein product [Lactuca saligna]